MTELLALGGFFSSSPTATFSATRWLGLVGFFFLSLSLPDPPVHPVNVVCACLECVCVDVSLPVTDLLLQYRGTSCHSISTSHPHAF